MNAYRGFRLGAGPGLLHWVLPLMLALVAVSVLLSGRDLAQQFQEMARGGGGMSMHPAVVWLQRLVSLVLVLICAERLLGHFTERRRLPAPVLTVTFLVYWACTVAAPALLGANPRISHEYLYTLIIGAAALVSTEPERERVFRAVRSALFVFLAAGVLMAAVQPSLVLDMQYRQGLLPGVPRFGGLAPHPVALGLLAQTFLLVLWVRPYKGPGLNMLAWMVGLGTLFLAQSKTAWIAFLLCAAALLAVRHSAAVWRRMADPRQAAYGIVVCLGAIVLVSTVVALLLFVDLGSRAADFVQTPEGAQLMTLTGRDQIWQIAMEEWRASPVFGHGPALWDDAFRASIGMPNATNAHNQFMDTLSRSGAVGAAALVLYSAVLLVLSVRYAGATGGLSLALFIALALRSISEVPMMVLGYGTEFFGHLLLIFTLIPALAARPARAYRGATATATAYRTVA
jgi:O-antigen ligase